MKIVVIGASGLIGSKLVDCLRHAGREVVGASPCSGLDTVTGEGLVEAVTGAQIAVDVSDSPSIEDKAAMDFFTTSSRNVMAAGHEVGIKHHIVLSYVGADRLRDSGYMRAKIAQEEIIRGAGIPYTIVRSTQAFESIDKLARPETKGEVRLSSVLMQPAASDDIAAVLDDIVGGAALNGMLEIAGPELISLSELARQVLSAREDPRPVLVDPSALYFGELVDRESLIPGPGARLMPTCFSNWLRQSISPD